MSTDGIVWDAPPANRGVTLDAIKHVESRGNPNAVSPAGAVGPYQFMPGTAAEMGVTNPRDEGQARNGADKYLKRLEARFGNPDHALLAYNWGPGNVNSWLRTGKGARGQPMPLEAQQYVEKVRTAEKNIMATGQPRTKALPQTNSKIVWDEPTSATGEEIQWDTTPPTVPPKSPPLNKAAKEVFDAEPPHMQALIASGKVFNDIGRAGRNALNWATGKEQEKNQNEDIDSVVSSTPAGMLGQYGTEIATTLLPSTGVAKGVLAVPRVVSVLRKGKAGADAAQKAYLAAKAAGEVSKVGELLGTVGMNAAAGSAAGAVANGMLDRDVSEGAVAGALVGGGLPLVGQGVSAVVKGVQNWGAGKEGAAVNALQHIFKGGRKDAVVNHLRSAAPIVEGEVVTSGRMATAEFPELAVLEKGARGRQNANLFTQADKQTVDARIAALKKGHEGAVREIDPVTGRTLPSEVESLRAQTTRPMYDAASRELVPISDELSSVLQSPLVSPSSAQGMKEFQQAVANARANGLPIPQGARGTPENPFANMSVDQLQRIRNHLNRRINGGDPNKIALEDARTALDNAINSSTSKFRDANQVHREMSMPQNRADVSNTLVEALQSPANDVTQRATVFNNALNNAKGVIKKSDLSPRFRNIEEVYAPTTGDAVTGPEQLARIKAVQESLRRESNASALPTTQGIVPKYLSPVEQVAEKAPNVLTRAATITRSLAKAIGRSSDKAVQDVIDKAVADPKMLADLISRVPPTERSAVINFFRDKLSNPNIVPLAVPPAVTTMND